MSSTRRDRFVRVAEARTSKVIKMLRLLGNCSNRAIYDYSDGDVKRIFRAIDSELRGSKAKFLSKKEDTFRLLT